MRHGELGGPLSEQSAERKEACGEAAAKAPLLVGFGSFFWLLISAILAKQSLPCADTCGPELRAHYFSKGYKRYRNGTGLLRFSVCMVTDNLNTQGTPSFTALPYQTDFK